MSAEGDTPGVAGRTRALYLLVAGLWGPRIVPSTPYMGLETWLARAATAPPLPDGLEQRACALFEIEPPEADTDLPVAAITRALDIGVIDSGWWVRADPVHLRPERDRLILYDNHVLRLTPTEAHRLAAEVSQAYSSEGWLLKAARPGRWYLKPPRAARIATTPLPDVVGKDIHPYLPRGRDGKAWHTLLNEVQILLHTAAVNAEREARGGLPVNSLWFWGSGRLPHSKRVDWRRVWSEEPVTLALARLSASESGGVPLSYDEWARAGDADGRHLVVIDMMRGPVLYEEGEEWVQQMQRLDAEWFQPAVAAVRAGDLDRLVLYGDHGPGFELTPRYARRWWRRRTSLQYYR